MGNVIGIELSLLEEIIRNIVRQEMKEMKDEIKETLISKQELLLQEERLSINQLTQILHVTRRTIYNYQKNGDLPTPNLDLSGHPYWKPEELATVLKKKGIRTALGG